MNRKFKWLISILCMISIFLIVFGIKDMIRSMDYATTTGNLVIRPQGVREQDADPDEPYKGYYSFVADGEKYIKDTDLNIERVTIKYNPDNPKKNIYLFQIYTEMIAGIVGIAICIVYRIKENKKINGTPLDRGRYLQNGQVCQKKDKTGTVCGPSRTHGSVRGLRA